jgi:RHS repeat-associated protein
VKIFTYDDRYQLTMAEAERNGDSTLWGSESYAYDKNGNRQSKNSTSYYYATGRNRLTSTSNPTVNYYYDADGDTTSDGTYQYSYGDHNRLSEVTANSGSTFVAAYKYDGFGRRVEKVLPNNQILFYFYDIDGRLITETGYMSELAVDHVYLDGEPVVRVDILGAGGMCRTGGEGLPEPDWVEIPPETLYFYHNDHLATPVAITNASGSVVWRGEYRPFGDFYSFPLAQITNNLRFPGQYFDAETGLHQNWFREYSPRDARYYQPDPIGTRAALNPYPYASSNPVNDIDPSGLFAMSPGPAESGMKAWEDTQRIFIDAWLMISPYGPRYAHCMASCKLTKRFGARTAAILGLAKEFLDVGLCGGGYGYEKACYSAFQFDDFETNAVGRSCSQEQDCETHCKDFRGKPDAGSSLFYLPGNCYLIPMTPAQRRERHYEK